MDQKHILTHYFSASDAVTTTVINNGLINKTFLVACGKVNYILQNINTKVFKTPKNIVENHIKINNILKNTCKNLQFSEPIKTLNGNYFVEEKFEFWRLTSYIENSKTIHKIDTSEMAYKAAKAFGEFYAEINNKPLQLADVLPDFINFEKRINDYKTILNNCDKDLKNQAKEEISFVENLIHLPQHWLDLKSKNQLPTRIIHADPKISNILFDIQNNPLSIIDLDTMMHESILYDYGDMIRSYTNKTEEDNVEISNNFLPEIYDAVKKGFLHHLEKQLTKTEIDNLDYAAQLVIYIQAVRFLSDFLNGSIYYQIHYPLQNLNRAKNQINLLKGLNAKLSS